MCTGAELIPIAIAAAGTTASTVAQQNALKNRDREAASGIMRQAEMQRQAGARVNENIQSLQKSNPNDEKAAAVSDFLQALHNSKQPGAADPLADVGGASSRYAEGVQNARTGVAANTAGLVQNTARIDAPLFQRVHEGQAAADTASQLGLIDNASRGQDFLTQMRVGAIQPNPWVTGLGSAAVAGAGAYAGRYQPGAAAPVGLTAAQKAELAKYVMPVGP